MTLFFLSAAEGITSSVECNWIILLKIIRAAANYVCMMELQHYQKFFVKFVGKLLSFFQNDGPKDLLMCQLQW